MNTFLNGILNINDYQNLSTFSNIMEFNKNNELVDLKYPIISETKNQALNGIKEKKNSLIFGDLLSDFGICSSENVISIGFLNDNKSSFYEKYLEKCDIVIEGEGNYILHEIIIKYILHDEKNIEKHLFKNKI